MINSNKIKCHIQLMRLDKPIGMLLLLWPALWALWIAAEGMPPVFILVIFVLGVVVMRSAGCVVNDIADRKVDDKVERTKQRPLATGALKIREAISLFFLLCFIGLVLVIQLNSYTLKLSFIALGLAIVYPFTKRIFHLPQLVLGAAFAWSVPMAFAAVNNHLMGITWIIFAIAVIWPLYYDSIYALMDKEDDIKVGIKSAAILFGDSDTLVLSVLIVTIVGGLTMLGFLLKFSWPYYLGVIGAALMMCYQMWLIRSRQAENYYLAFYNNHWVGFTVWLGIVFNYLCK